MNKHHLRTIRLALLTALLVLTASAASATTFTITATGDGYYYTPLFSPSTLTIHAGDSVTFHNPGLANGGGMHNVHADDNSFQCSASCSGPNNTPNSNAWSFTRTFNTVGTVPFHCDMHGGPGGVGMSGTITVEAAAATGTLAFGASTYSVSGSATTMAISVGRSGGSSGAASVHYATSDGSAKAGVDYTASSGTLNWADGDAAAKTFNVPILKDSSATSNLTLNLTLSAATGATLGSPGIAVLTIQESTGSAGVFSFSQSSYSASENEGSATITVNRTGGKSGVVTVHYATSAGTAVNGKNFTNASGVLSFASGDTSKTFSVPLIDDHTVDPTLTVQLALSSPTGGANLGTASARLNILDSDSGGAVPAAPSNLVAVALDTGTIQLTWKDNSSNETAFDVQFSTLGGTFADFGTVSPNITTAQVTGLNAATGYQFQVRAIGSGGNSAFSNTAQASTDAVPVPCVASTQTLCVGDNGRFQVQVSFLSSTSSGAATTVPLASNPDSGLFYFFSSSNIEMLVKVLNACTPPFNSYWVFFAATTNVQFTTTVIDTANGKVKTYFNPQGQSALPVQDTSAFATCP